jgi:hypothetical protein
MLPLVLCKPAARNLVSPLADFLPVDPIPLEVWLGVSGVESELGGRLYYI